MTTVRPLWSSTPLKTDETLRGRGRRACPEGGGRSSARGVRARQLHASCLGVVGDGGREWASRCGRHLQKWSHYDKCYPTPASTVCHRQLIICAPALVELHATGELVQAAIPSFLGLGAACILPGVCGQAAQRYRGPSLHGRCSAGHAPAGVVVQSRMDMSGPKGVGHFACAETVVRSALEHVFHTTYAARPGFQRHPQRLAFPVVASLRLKKCMQVVFAHNMQGSKHCCESCALRSGTYSARPK